MPKVLRFMVIPGLALAALLAASGCSPNNGPMLSDLRLSSAAIASTAGRGSSPLSVYYSLGRPALVSAYLSSPAGDRLYLEKEEPRPSAGSYSLTLRGVYAPDPTREDRQALPSGQYDLVIEARDSEGVQQHASVPLKVEDSDPLPLTVDRPEVTPNSLSPNFDSVDDDAAISYRTSKPATVSLYLESATGKRFLLERRQQPAGEHSTTWNGQIGSQAPPSGEYRLLIRAEDGAGNVAVVERTLSIKPAALTDAHITSVSFQPEKQVTGTTVKVQIRVKNSGSTVMRSGGPAPGYSYSAQEPSGLIGRDAYDQKPGLWQVGVDWATNRDASGTQYPYRWGLGKDLQPGEETAVVGYIPLGDRYPTLWLWAGLIQEPARYWDGDVGRTMVEAAR